ncbi:MAG: PilT/PilU family type 4a pilus ATPase [Lentisphaerae bacterium]|jgi:twitching motility protein PilT|nr:PilT/PilU family type 4a pilus ATPase [Lentisphaerota bacterium]
MSITREKTFIPREALQRLFSHCEAVGASDIHLSAVLAPRFRVQGRLAADAVCGALSADEVEECGLALVLETLPQHTATLEAARELLWRSGAVDGATTSRAGDRYRFNVYRENGTTAVALRRLDDSFQTLEELGLPPQLARFSEMRDGLVVVTGPTGSGKSTTLATLIDQINRKRDCHIITIEDPVEYVHVSQRSLVHQRQIGRDAASFNAALVESLRQDPDVILVGEIREIETIRTAITAAETGHLVFTTLHAGDCVGAIERLVAVFPTGEQEGIRRQLALVLRGIFAQHLLPPLQEGGRRVASGELLLVNSAIANLIANAKSPQIYSSIETGAGLGMQTLDQSLAQLINAGRISEQTATAMSRNPSLLKDRLRNGNGRGVL